MEDRIEGVDWGGVSHSRGVGGSPNTTRNHDNEAKLVTQVGTQFTYFTDTKVQILTEVDMTVINLSNSSLGVLLTS